MLEVILMIGDFMMSDYNTIRFITDKYGLGILDVYFDDLEHYQSEYIVLVDGVPYKWFLWGVK